ncbi:beta-ketoacyl-[acyl-carrier-protein] synthase family protein [Dickeya poaceiphila]|uniref:3-oxoacyl-ACP synthase n=1 Tax=Dickeya poaceiphila TaxID=568768 RepID=A0A5B8IDF4_9GAMM|nr:3-oxoacyl-ACP synthase [Dickeya poaceiphila]QDX31498.1 3-oxoacyl-ACP synthase [Dickeya poaceiphila]
MYINHITHLISPTLTPISELSERYKWGNRNDKIFSRFHNLKSASLFRDTALPTLLQNLTNKIIQECEPSLLENLDFIVWAHSLHAVAPFDVNSVIQAQFSHVFNNKNIEFFSVTQASCASGMLAMKFIQAKLDAGKWRNGLLITGEKCFHKTVQYVDQNGYFGEGLSASVISATPAQAALNVKALEIKQLAEFGTRMRATTRESENKYDSEFLPTMHKAIHQSLSQATYKASELNYLLPYHISPVTFDRLADRVGFSRDIIYKDNLYTLGHCFCSDAFINLGELISQQGNNLQGKIILSLASGVAGTFATMIIKSETGVTE